MPDPSQGPWVSFAVLCEKTLEDKAGKLSLINLVDEITIAVQDATGQGAPEEMPVVKVTLMGAIGFKSGILKGPQTVKLSLVKPSGATGSQLSVNTLFQGDERGTNIISQLNLELTEEGLYWLDVLIQDQLMTRIPLRVAYQRIVFG